MKLLQTMVLLSALPFATSFAAQGVQQGAQQGAGNPSGETKSVACKTVKPGDDYHTNDDDVKSGPEAVTVSTTGTPPGSATGTPGKAVSMGMPENYNSHAARQELVDRLAEEYRVTSLGDVAPPTVLEIEPGQARLQLTVLDPTAAAGHVLRLAQREHLLAWSDGGWSSVAVSDIEIMATGRVIEAMISLTIDNLKGSTNRLTVVDRMVITFDAGSERQWNDLWRANDPIGYAAVLRGQAAAQVESMRRGLRIQCGDRVVLSDDPDIKWNDLVDELLLAPNATAWGLSSSGALPGGLSPSMKWFRCIYDCFGTLSTPIGIAGLICIATGGAGCTAAVYLTGGIGAAWWTSCMGAVLTGCGYFSVIGELAAMAACILKCTV